MHVDFYTDGQQTESQTLDNDFNQLKLSPLGRHAQRVIRFSLPIVDMQCYWFPKMEEPSNNLAWIITNLSAPQDNIPYLAFSSMGQRNRASIALDNFTDDICINAKMNQERCNYDVTITIAEQPATQPYTLTIDCRHDLLWTEAQAQWFRGLNLPDYHFPNEAWNPVYCTWYVVHAAVTQDWVEKAVRQAVNLGFKTLIVDDGWSYPDMKRVTPKNLENWYETIGNWTVSKDKFPDFKQHVKRVQDMGMRYLVWTAPFLIGDKSELYEDFKNCLLPERHTEGCLTFNPKCKEKWDVILTKLAALLTDYNLDGLKVDFLDYIYPNVDSPRGPETMDFITELSRRLRSIKPEALIEFRQSYANPQMLPYATQFRAGDVPFDYYRNFSRLGQIRVILGGGDNIPIHADPIYWHPQDTPVNIARHMIASLAGVPMLSMELADLTQEARDIITFWLSVYRNHQRLFNHGHWTVSYHPNGISWQQVTLEDETAIILADEARLPQALKTAAGKTLFLLNLSPEPLAVPNAKTVDYRGTPSPDGTIPCGGMGTVTC